MHELMGNNKVGGAVRLHGDHVTRYLDNSPGFV